MNLTEEPPMVQMSLDMLASVPGPGNPSAIIDLGKALAKLVKHFTPSEQEEIIMMLAETLEEQGG